ncbi:hypothetical protein IT774_14180 [Salinimonas marina]|uniref:Uncharacterized protein n=1 Tax=Salinimonas marina TaxID=2785918 RepID=A0A7S9DWJ9_9ALTE|nr:hypothetical protein [Salinimonas marina]QPG05249.1 hypothetical protein IT774_14180 [Salinimonas marina]
MRNEEPSESITIIKSDAKKAIWVLLILNVFVALLALGGEREFVIVAIFVQVAILLLWLLPVFLYQVLIRKQDLAVSIWCALASYKDLMGQVQWP